MKSIIQNRSSSISKNNQRQRKKNEVDLRKSIRKKIDCNKMKKIKRYDKTINICQRNR